MRVSIIVPAYNERKAIKKVIDGIKAVSPENEIIVVDDGSTDGTYEIAKKLKGVKIFRHKRNKGKAAALKTGFRNAKYDVIVTIDADGTHPPREIPKLIKILNDYDLVVGSRFKKGIQKETAFHRGLANMFGAFLASIILCQRVTDASSGMRIFRRDLIEKIDIKAKGLDFEAEFTSRVISKGFKYKEVAIKVNKALGRSNLNFIKDNFRFFMAILRGRIAD